MNAEALQHAAGCCRTAARQAQAAADRADVVLHRVPAAGRGFRREVDQLRDYATGLTVSASFMARCARFPEIEDALSALERGDTLVPCSARSVKAVVVRNDEKPVLLARLRSVIGACLPFARRAA